MATVTSDRRELLSAERRFYSRMALFLVALVFIGFAPPGYTGRVFPWADDMMDARALLGNLDVGIAPLVRNRWADGKSDVKALEYAMAGVMPIVHDAPPYSPWKDMGWEWCPRNEREWEEAIHDVVAMRDDVKDLAAEAKAYVLAERTIDMTASGDARW